ncbi:hypothetical protein SAM23877_2764 [Streptomyces ambofaciens ATCC 23877]|uniref:Uncharacterized protein n=1 Tax=Streptomyces ambofaciens (strain ATCC 23877 / 3486 / DSM 40053 / JCM 4204 / NBRC 12836 / NRRL B-2516) TaxID=278992 RepID=A0A0K2AS39_STRA7|nr:hypothetical protein SAM23877_2764 [Streptomyces ambofaciens ATCC 23877]
MDPVSDPWSVRGLSLSGVGFGFGLVRSGPVAHDARRTTNSERRPGAGPPTGRRTRAPSHVPVRIPPTGSGRASVRTAPESLC